MYHLEARVIIKLLLLGLPIILFVIYVLVRDIRAFIEDRRSLHMYLELKEAWLYAEQQAKHYIGLGYTTADIDSINSETERDKIRIKTCMDIISKDRDKSNFSEN